MADSAIRTPDQRVRVFVSSTLQELAPERVVARAAIERLHLAPVMFELGARPHPPRELYRAYLAQSQIFIGVYGNRYGWVAPGETVSGLEDEYLLSQGLPHLIYVRATDDGREERLDQLLDRIRDDDTASYRSYSSVDELATLVEDDLAALLTERFQAPRPMGSEIPSAAPPRIPLTALLGRESEVTVAVELLSSSDGRLVTLVGSGGSGKTRIALELLKDLAPTFPDGAWFVDLSAVRTTDAVMDAIAQTLGVRDSPGIPTGRRLAQALAERKSLLVLDNFEQVLDAGADVVELLEATRELSILVTSRSPLRVRAEQTLEVGPLPEEAARTLFVQRTRAVRPDFIATPTDAPVIEEICRKLDRLPLAIELAAARMRPLTASGLLQRIGRTLPQLDRGRRDLPARQRTLRDTIAWSVDLLTPAATQLFARLGVFAGLSDSESIRAVCGPDVNDDDTIGVLEELVDASLVRAVEQDGQLVFSMLMTVREFALEMLESRGEADALRRRHDDYFLAFAEDARQPGDMATGFQALLRLERLKEEAWTAGDRFAAEGQTEKLAQMSWSLLILAWATSRFPHVMGWIDTALAGPEPLSPRSKARAAMMAGSVVARVDVHELERLKHHVDDLHVLGDQSGEAFARGLFGWFHLRLVPPDVDGATRELATAAELGTRSRDILALQFAKFALGQIALVRGDLVEARTQVEELHAYVKGVGWAAAEIVTLDNLSLIEFGEGNVDAGRARLAEAFDLATRLRHQEGISRGLERISALAATDGEPVRSARLLGAARRQRQISGYVTFEALEDHLPVLQRELGEREADAEIGVGMRMGPDEAIAYARSTIAGRDV
jgi:predicted ATPase